MRKPSIQIPCIHCGQIFTIKQHRKDTAKYCSRRCGALHVRIRHTAICIICKSSFEHISSRACKAKYCSRKCYHLGQREKGKTIYTCHHCNKEFKGHLSDDRKFCSRACVGKATLDIWKPSFTTVRKSLNTRGKIKQCEKCGYAEEPRILGVHHIDRNRNNNSLENLIVLCANCHSLEHLKHIHHHAR